MPVLAKCCLAWQLESTILTNWCEMSTPILTPEQARIVAVLMEKQRTVPDSYPLSLAALVSGCNQKTAREPVMNLSDQDVLQALAELRQHDWVIETSGSRVLRYEHNAVRKLQVPVNGMILLAVLVLRGPQTVAELRANSQRWYEFVDNSSVEAFLDELAARSSGALVTRLARQPGSRESRWAHLLSGEVAMAAPAGAVAAVSGAAAEQSRVGALEARIERLERDLAELRTLLGVDESDSTGAPDATGAA